MAQDMQLLQTGPGNRARNSSDGEAGQGEQGKRRVTVFKAVEDDGPDETAIASVVTQVGASYETSADRAVGHLSSISGVESAEGDKKSSLRDRFRWVVQVTSLIIKSMRLFCFCTLE